jgi:glycosyltransferase involved in cell wall biosynthesis
VLVLLAEGFQKNGHRVTVVTFYGTDQDFYKLPDGVQRLALDIVWNSPTLFHALWHKLYRLWILRRAIQSTQPDVVISFIDQMNVITALALTKTGYPLIATEHCDPSMFSYGFIWEKLRRLTYRNIERIVSVSKGVDRYFEWLPTAKRVVIYNPLAPLILSPTSGEQASDKPLVGGFSSKDATHEAKLYPRESPKEHCATVRSLIAMGRLSREKRFDLLLQAFARLKDFHPEWALTILGEGKLRTELESLCNSLGLSERVHLPGVVLNPYEVLLQADLFVMSSCSEGFGNALIEAMACGLAVISTDCPCGPREIIRNGVDGILVPNQDVDALAAAMDHLMSDEEERKRLSVRAIEAVERFSLEKIMGMWEKLLAQVVEERI